MCIGKNFALSYRTHTDLLQMLFRGGLLRRGVWTIVVVHSGHREGARECGTSVPYDRTTVVHRSTRRTRCEAGETSTLVCVNVTHTLTAAETDG
jgi:hypothetical protein